ncbi:MAG TPA: hypothetical protein VFH95_06385 [Candidatus Kapabacteria bacterium]|nr:hypothetical protein [Candidatus Kapabacteria bacterium]
MRFAKGNEGKDRPYGRVYPAAIAISSEETIFGVFINRDEAGKSFRVPEHDAEIRERMVGTAAGHSKNSDIALPLPGKIFERFFEIVAILLGDANDFGAAFFEIAKRVRCDGIEIADNRVAWEPKRPRLFRAAIGAESELGARGIFERVLADLTAKNDESECVQNQGFFAFTCMMSKYGFFLTPSLTIS